MQAVLSGLINIARLMCSRDVRRQRAAAKVAMARRLAVRLHWMMRQTLP